MSYEQPKFTGPFHRPEWDGGYILDDNGQKLATAESWVAADLIVAALNAQFYASEFATHLKGEP